MDGSYQISTTSGFEEAAAELPYFSITSEVLLDLFRTGGGGLNYVSLF